MVRIARPTDKVRLEMLKIKIRDQEYLRLAIDRIASKLTDEIVNRGGQQNEYKN